MAVASIKDFVYFFCHVFITERGIVRKDGFKLVIEHNGRMVIILGVAYPFSCLNRANDMRMPVLASIAIDIAGSLAA
jgi:hypothetical protein